jgi:hypothetical protein
VVAKAAGEIGVHLQGVPGAGPSPQVMGTVMGSVMGTGAPTTNSSEQLRGRDRGRAAARPSAAALRRADVIAILRRRDGARLTPA